MHGGTLYEDEGGGGSEYFITGAAIATNVQKRSKM